MDRPETGPVPRLDVAGCRRQFPALERVVDGRPAMFLDGPAGSQVPRTVIEAMVRYLERTNANNGGLFATSRESGHILGEAARAVADLLGTADPQTVAFGPNMTTLTFALSRAMARTWHAGDEILVTRSDHDANVTPWVLAARDAGAVVRHVAVHPEDCTLDLDDLRGKLSSRTRVLALGCASNASGTVHPFEEIVRRVHEVGGQVVLDAVHFAPHLRMAVEAWDADFVSCSAYKFFGPHVGVLWGKRELLEALPVYKVRPASDSVPDRWMQGTQNHEGIAGAGAAIEYLADIGRQLASAPVERREALDLAFRSIQRHEQDLACRLLEGLASLPEYRVWGITETGRIRERVPTVSLTHGEIPPRELARRLGERGIFAWHGNFYALPLTTALGLEPDGMLRLGLLHYNTEEEVDRLLVALSEIV